MAFQMDDSVQGLGLEELLPLPGGARPVAVSGGASDAPVCAQADPSTKKVLHEVLTGVNRLSISMASLRKTVLHHLDSASSELSSMKGAIIKSSSEDASVPGQTAGGTEPEVSPHSGEQLPVGTPGGEIGAGSIPEMVESGDSSILTSLKEALADIRSRMTARDAVLEKLEARLAAGGRPGQGCEAGGVQEVTGEAQGPEESIPEVNQGVHPVAEDKAKLECLEAMMRMTEILNSTEEKVSLVRSIYDKLYTEHATTSCILTFLQTQPQVKIKIDCDSYYIEKMRPTFLDHDGVEKEGVKYHMFADFDERTVYLGAGIGDGNKEEWVIGDLVYACAHMAIYLAFENGGRPYAEGDEVNAKEYKRIIEEADGQKEGELKGVLEWHQALFKKTQLGKEIYFIGVVPGMIAEFGYEDGTSQIRSKTPSLLTFYEKQVVTTLVKMSRV